jgi:1,4-alpha-glucan branching enzyme
LLEHPSHKGIYDFVKDLNHLYLAEPALYEMDYDWRGFEWVDFRDADSTIISFLRKGNDSQETILFVFNFTPVPRENYRLGVPYGGFWRELINSDSEIYGGSNFGLGGGCHAEPVESHGRSFSLNLFIPPLGFIALKH